MIRGWPFKIHITGYIEAREMGNHPVFDAAHILKKCFSTDLESITGPIISLTGMTKYGGFGHWMMFPLKSKRESRGCWVQTDQEKAR